VLVCHRHFAPEGQISEGGGLSGWQAGFERRNLSCLLEVLKLLTDTLFDYRHNGLFEEVALVGSSRRLDRRVLHAPEYVLLLLLHH